MGSARAGTFIFPTLCLTGFERALITLLHAFSTVRSLHSFVQDLEHNQLSCNSAEKTASVRDDDTKSASFASWCTWTGIVHPYGYGNP
jgi:hypothetical protein